jgi:hypothetical protein
MMSDFVCFKKHTNIQCGFNLVMQLAYLVHCSLTDELHISKTLFV